MIVIVIGGTNVVECNEKGSENKGDNDCNKAQTVRVFIFVA